MSGGAAPILYTAFPPVESHTPRPLLRLTPHAGPLQQPKGQTSVFYTVPPPRPPRAAGSGDQQPGASASIAQSGEGAAGQGAGAKQGQEGETVSAGAARGERGAGEQ